jgi:ribosomal protein S18 acetylase RimI-like enzyme
MLLRQAIRADAPQIARVDVDTWRSAYRGILPGPYLDGLSYAGRERLWLHFLSERRARQTHPILVFEDYLSGEIAGFSSAGPERRGSARFRGELYTLYVLERYQGQRLGRRLVQGSAALLAGQGMRSMLVWVLAENPARHFYESLGGRYLKSEEIQIGGVGVEQVAYGWEDTRVLGYTGGVSP